MLPALIALAGCGGALVSGSSSGSLSISPGTATIDDNCTGCNTTTTSGGLAEQFSATVSGSAANVNWTVSGGDAKSGPGTINSSGQYTPPAYLTADSVQVTVTAELASSPSTTASAALTVTPGFLQPLTPQNVALGANGTVTITGYIAEAGGATGINYGVSNSSTGSSGGQGSLGSSICTHSSNAFTYCTVTYTAPASVTATASTYVVATIGTSTSKEATRILLNTEGISSNPAGHQKELATPILLGSSGGNNNDYDTKGNQIVDCCGGTLGSLIQNSGGTEYLLSCNHVLARSDQASVGEMIVQPGLIDNNCTPYGDGSGTTPVGSLTAWLPLSSNATNVDAAIAQVDSGAVKTSGDILELGTLQAGGTLAAAPPGISSTGGRGESGSLNLVVAKSGRTTGLTCASISALNLNVKVEYYKDCGETTPYLTKTYTNQIAIEGSEFSDAGDSGSLVVDAGNAEPVGLFFAGGVTNTGVSEGVANPAPTVLAELGSQEGTTYTFVGTTDHPVSCLNYGAATVTVAQSTTLSGSQLELAQQALGQARMLVNPTMGILGVAAGKSNDRAGAEPDAAESRVFWRGRGPKPRQSRRGVAGHLCRSQAGSRDTATDHQRPARTVRHHGSAPRHALVPPGTGSIHGALHGASSYASGEWPWRASFAQATGFAAVKAGITSLGSQLLPYLPLDESLILKGHDFSRAIKSRDRRGFSR